MRLVDTTTCTVKEFADGDIPPYVILSHVWGLEELTLQDLQESRATGKRGYEKLRRCCKTASVDGFDYVWLDTCCIDKTSSAELSEAINSMFYWYQEAETCYAYLADVTSTDEIPHSAWFTRGWTLQELIAPSTLTFFDQDWNALGTKLSLQSVISKCARIPTDVLTGKADLDDLSIAQKMSWAAGRKTTRIEDRAYSLMGMFGINMPLIYGEREKAFIRLQEEIMRISDDHTLFAWKSQDSRGGVLAMSPDAFRDSATYFRSNPFGTPHAPPSISSRGVYIELPFVGTVCHQGLGLAVLYCRDTESEDESVAIYVKDQDLMMEKFERICTEEVRKVDLSRLRLSQYPMRRICIRLRHAPGPRRLQANKTTTNEELTLVQETELSKIAPTLPHTLEMAAAWGLAHKVWYLLTQSDIESWLRTEDGRITIWRAAEGGNETVLKILLAQSGITAKGLNESKEDQPPPLMTAVMGGHYTIARLLLERGADPDPDNIHLFQQGSALSFAAEKGYEAIARLLIDNGAKKFWRGLGSRMPLSFAAEKGHVAIVKMLLGQDNNWNGSLESPSPLSYAAQGGHESIVRLLLQDDPESLNTIDGSGRTPLSYACESGHENVAQLLLESGADSQYQQPSATPPICYAAKRGHAHFVRLLIEQRADIDAKDSGHQSALCLAADQGYEDIVRVLLENGADPDSLDDERRTALSYACHQGYDDIVTLLVDEGATLDIQDQLGRTALSYAAGKGWNKVVEILVAQGARLDSKDRNHKTALYYAVLEGHGVTAQLLVKNGAQLKPGTTKLRYKNLEKAVRMESPRQPSVASEDTSDRPLRIWRPN